MKKFNYLAQFYNPVINQYFTFHVIARKNCDFNGSREDINSVVCERANMVCVLDNLPSREDVDLDFKTNLIVKCRDTYFTGRGMVVKEKELLEWINAGMSKEQPPRFYEMRDL